MANIQDTLAVINTKGEAWARTLDLPGGKIGPGVKLAGPTLFGGADDQFVVGSAVGAGGAIFINQIAVVTTSGAYWPRVVDNTTIGPGVKVSGSLFGGANAKYLLDASVCGVYVVNNQGQVWNHFINGSGNTMSVGVGTKLNGPTLFGAPNDKYVVSRGGSILVINTKGEVWEHDLSTSQAGICPDIVSAGRKLNGPGLFGGPNDKYVVYIAGHLLVIDTLGQVWARSVSTAVGPGTKLNGPGLFGGPNDKYVVAYQVIPTQ